MAETRHAQAALAVKKGTMTLEEVPSADRAAVKDLLVSSEDDLADMTKRPAEMRSEAVARALAESARRKQQPGGPFRKLFDKLTGN